MAHKKIESIKDLQPDVLNANKGTPRGLQMVEDSLRQYGAGRSILVDKRGGVIAGERMTTAFPHLKIEREAISRAA